MFFSFVNIYITEMTATNTAEEKCISCTVYISMPKLIYLHKDATLINQCLFACPCVNFFSFDIPYEGATVKILLNKAVNPKHLILR